MCRSPGYPGHSHPHLTKGVFTPHTQHPLGVTALGPKPLILLPQAPPRTSSTPIPAPPHCSQGSPRAPFTLY